MKKVLKITIVIVAMFVVIISVSSLVKLIALRSESGNEMTGESLEYYNTILKLAKKSKTVDFGQVFDFEWEKMYFQKDEMNPYILDERLGIETYVCDAWWGYPYRIIFINNNEIVFDFLYDSVYIEFDKTDVFVSRENSTFEIRKKWGKLLISVPD